MSFYTALTGLNAATASLGVISNNIANVGTTGFKRSRADFGDIFATSPLQKASSVIGQGVALKSVTQEFSQGNLQFSASSLDIAITGDGFFPLKSPDGLQDIYTRNGTFLLNDSFAVVNSAGQALMAASVDSSGKADLENLRKLIIPRSTNGDARETTEIQLGLNLPADGAVIDRPFDPADPQTYNLTTAVTVFDAGGNEYLATVYYAKTQRASPEDPSNKWQTYVYIGDTKLDEFLIQASTKAGESLYVNKYGQVKSENEIPPQDIARGVTKLFNLDRLTNKVDSRPADYASELLSTTDLESLKNGVFDIYATLMDTSGTETDSTDDLALFPDPTPLEGAPDATKNPEIYFHLKVDGSPNGTKVDLSDLFSASADRPTYRGVELARILEARINKAYGDQKYFDLSSLADENDPDQYNFFTLKVTNREGTSSKEASLTATAEEIQAMLLAANSEFRTIDDTPIEDGGELDIRRLTADQLQIIVRGLIAATGDQDDEANNISNEFDEVVYSPADQNFRFKARDGGTVSIRTYSPNQLSNAVFDLTSTFKTVNPDTGVYSGVVIPNGGSLRSFNANYSQSDQRYGIKVEFDDTQQVFKILSGTTGDASSVEILAPTVSIDNTDPENPVVTRATAAELDSLFTGADEGPADPPSSDVAAYLNFRKIFNFIPGAKAQETTEPVRGVRSRPAEVLGTPIGLNLDNKFKLTADTNTFTVTVDNVTGLIQLPTDREFTKDTFRALLEDRINKLEDSRGRTVNGVKVRYVTEGNATRLVINTGTEGNDSFLKITGPSIWGLKDLGSARGSTEQWIGPPQAENINGVPLYVDRDGNETTEAGDFDEDETRELWSPIFLDKGELTFNTRGELQSPAAPIRFKATTIGETGATLQFSIDYNGTTQFSSPFGVLAQDQNGRPEGDLIGLDIGDDGLVSANYSNGSQKNLAKIILANFSAPTGLRQIGDASYYATSKSGAVQLGEAGTAGYGTIRAGARERANVDLTAELIDLITAQRAFQANAKAIETNNTLTQAIINIRS